MSIGAPNRRRFMQSGVVAAACAGAGACSDAGRPLAAADTHPEGYPTVEAVKHVARRVAELTGGRLRIKSYPGGQLGEEKDTLEIAIFGGIDLNRVNLAPLNGVAPMTKAPALPFLFRSIGHMRRAMDGPAGRRILDSLEPHGLIGLCFYDSGARSFYNVKRAIRAPEDLKGLKIRVQSSDLYIAMVRALGANPTPIPYGEVYQALVQGVVDGAENNWPSFESSRHYEVARHYTLTGHVMAPEVLVASARRWRVLSDGDRAALRQAATESVAVMRALWDRREAESRAKVLAAGVEVIESIDSAAFAEKMAPVWAPVVADPAIAEVVDMIRIAGAENV